MKISLVQTSLAWEGHEANRQHFSQLINTIGQTDLIVLPEMFTTGFTMNPEAVAEAMDGESVQWMKNVAVERNCAVTGSLVIKEGDNYYNRLLFVFPDGKIETYDKRHLFAMAGEGEVYTKGKKRLIVEYKGWRICPFVCYDLRFPVFARNTEEIDLLIYVASWPVPRILAWDTLLRARAIENMCYVAGVNRTGRDDNGHQYPGHSQAFDCLGATIIEPSDKDGVFTVTLNKEAMLETRKKFPFLKDKDSFILQD